MLREEVLTKWDSCKAKLATVRLTPKEKETWKFLKSSKLDSFSVHDSSQDLEKWEKELKVEQSAFHEKDIDENDMLMDYWFIWEKFCSTVLDWIGKKREIDTLYEGFENMKYRIEVFEGIRDRITNFSEVNRAYHNDEKTLTTFYAVARSKWPTILLGNKNWPLHQFISSISYYANFGETEIKEVETKWNQELLPKIKDAFY